MITTSVWEPMQHWTLRTHTGLRTDAALDSADTYRSENRCGIGLCGHIPVWEPMRHWTLRTHTGLRTDAALNFADTYRSENRCSIGLCRHIPVWELMQHWTVRTHTGLRTDAALDSADTYGCSVNSVSLHVGIQFFSYFRLILLIYFIEINPVTWY
jgi:hypothetical protein